MNYKFFFLFSILKILKMLEKNDPLSPLNTNSNFGFYPRRYWVTRYTVTIIIYFAALSQRHFAVYCRLLTIVQHDIGSVSHHVRLKSNFLNISNRCSYKEEISAITFYLLLYIFFKNNKLDWKLFYRNRGLKYSIKLDFVYLRRELAHLSYVFK